MSRRRDLGPDQKNQRKKKEKRKNQNWKRLKNGLSAKDLEVFFKKISHLFGCY